MSERGGESRDSFIYHNKEGIVVIYLGLIIISSYDHVVLLVLLLLGDIILKWDGSFRSLTTLATSSPLWRLGPIPGVVIMDTGSGKGSKRRLQGGIMDMHNAMGRCSSDELISKCGRNVRG